MFETQHFIKPVYKLIEVPKDDLPSLVIAGRSNVGKSSFINSFFNRKNLAKTSSTPGKTRSINFYLIDKTFFLIDLPGIGYAKTGKSEGDALGRLISDFISRYKNITHILHLIDSRHKPTRHDLLLDELIMNNGHPVTIILTKADKLRQSDISEAKRNMKEFYPGKNFNEDIFLYSSVNGTGRKEISKKIASLFYAK
jgi:GTP-binding protein